VLVAGGFTGSAQLASTEIYDPGLGFSEAWRPVVTTVSSPLENGYRLHATGSGFRGFGLSETTGGQSNSSATNYPLVRLYRLDNGQVEWLPFKRLSETALTTRELEDFNAGPAIATVIVNGIPGIAQYLRVDAPYPEKVYLPLLRK
jgi:hypothetical protein